MKAKSPFRSALALTLVAGVGCAPGDKNATAPVTIVRIVVALGSPNLTVNETTRATAKLIDDAGNEHLGRPVAWASSDATVASVSNDGLVTALSAGSVAITASAEGVSGTSSLTVRPSPVASVTVVLSSSALTVGQTAQATATLRDANGNVLTGRPIVWSTSDALVATVSSSGGVTGSAPGTAMITAASEGTTGSATLTVSSTLPAPVLQAITSPACSQINLHWTMPSPYAASVVEYRVYRNGMLYRTVAKNATRFADIGVPAATTHTYALRAVDDVGTISPASMPLQGTTGTCPSGVYYCGPQPDGTTIPCGTVFLDAVTDAVSNRDRIIAYRTKFRVDLNAAPAQQTNAQDWKIVFNFLAFYNPSGPAGGNETGIQAANLWSHSSPWQGNTCNQLPTPSVREADFRMAVTDHFGDHRFGLKSLDPEVATNSWEIDGIRGLWFRSAELPVNLNEKDVAFELVRGELTTDPTDWACPQWTIPPDTYRVWYGTVMVDGRSYRMAALLPEARARYMRPAVTAQLGTENFSVSPGPFRGYYWDTEVQTEGSSTWQALEAWRVPAADYGVEFFGYGFKVGLYGGRKVIEASQDGTDTYAKIGETLSLRP